MATRADAYRWWAADNGCFSQGAAFDEWAWFSWLASLPDVGRRRRCLFAEAPDVLGGAEGAWTRSRSWFGLVLALGIPVALVAQNGAADHAPMWENADEWDVLFVGGAPECRCRAWVRTDPADRRRRCPHCGSTLSEWKLSEAARLCVQEAAWPASGSTSGG